jgi:hypothetical protein
MYIETLRGLGPKEVICVSLEVSCAEAVVAARSRVVRERVSIVGGGKWCSAYMNGEGEWEVIY